MKLSATRSAARTPCAKPRTDIRTAPRSTRVHRRDRRYRPRSRDRPSGTRSRRCRCRRRRSALRGIHVRGDARSAIRGAEHGPRGHVAATEIFVEGRGSIRRRTAGMAARPLTPRVKVPIHGQHTPSVELDVDDVNRNADTGHLDRSGRSCVGHPDPVCAPNRNPSLATAWRSWRLGGDQGSCSCRSCVSCGRRLRATSGVPRVRRSSRRQGAELPSRRQRKVSRVRGRQGSEREN